MLAETHVDDIDDFDNNGTYAGAFLSVTRATISAI